MGVIGPSPIRSQMLGIGYPQTDEEAAESFFVKKVFCVFEDYYLFNNTNDTWNIRIHELRTSGLFPVCSSFMYSYRKIQPFGQNAVVYPHPYAHVHAEDIATKTISGRGRTESGSSLNAFDF